MGLTGWLIAFVVFIGIEAATLALTTIWFAGGSLAGFLVCLLGFRIEVQLAAFVLVSFVLLVLTRPMAVRHVNRHTKKTNVESLIGKQAKITETVDNEAGTGTAMLNGQEWTARAAKDGLSIPKGSLVFVQEIQGVKLMVSPVKEGELSK